jgi:hypothetical protein
MTKTLNQSIFFFLHQNQNIFFSNIGNQNIFLDISRLDISHISPHSDSKPTSICTYSLMLLCMLGEEVTNTNFSLWSSWSWAYGSWIDVLDTTLYDNVCQWLVTGLWFSPGTSTNKTHRNDIAEICLKVALKIN